MSRLFDRKYLNRNKIARFSIQHNSSLTISHLQETYLKKIIILSHFHLKHRHGHTYCENTSQKQEKDCGLIHLCEMVGCSAKTTKFVAVSGGGILRSVEFVFVNQRNILAICSVVSNRFENLFSFINKNYTSAQFNRLQNTTTVLCQSRIEKNTN